MVRAESVMRGVSIDTFLDLARNYDKYVSEIEENCKEFNFVINDQKAGYQLMNTLQHIGMGASDRQIVIESTLEKLDDKKWLYISKSVKKDEIE